MSVFRAGTNKSSINNFPNFKPIFNLEFANTKTLDPRITLNRPTGGSYVGPDGFIKYAGINEPRFDHDPITGESLGLLIEEPKTNLILSSNTFSGSTDISVLRDSTISPDGTANATLMYENQTDGFHFLSSGISGNAVAGVTYCASIFCRYAGTKNIIRLKLADATGQQNNIFVDLRTGDILSGSSGVNNRYGVIKHANGWYRIYTTITCAQSGDLGVQPFLLRESDRSSVYLGDGYSGFYIYGFQLETTSFPTSYIPTQGSARSRATDLLDITGVNFSNYFTNSSPENVSFFYSATSPYTIINGVQTHSPFYFSITNTTFLERIDFRYAGLPQIIPILNGVSALGVFPNVSNLNDIKAVGTISKGLVTIIMNDSNPNYEFAKSINVLKRLPVGLNRLTIGSSPTGALALNGRLRKFCVYLNKLSESEAINLIK